MYHSGSRTEAAQALRKRGGQWMRELRLQAGLSQREMAAQLGLDYYTFISQLESGAGRVPPERYAEWAKVLRINPRDFVRTTLFYYDPITYRMLFGSSAEPSRGLGKRLRCASPGVRATDTLLLRSDHVRLAVHGWRAKKKH